MILVVNMFLTFWSRKMVREEAPEQEALGVVRIERARNIQVGSESWGILHHWYPWCSLTPTTSSEKMSSTPLGSI